MKRSLQSLLVVLLITTWAAHQPAMAAEAAARASAIAPFVEEETAVVAHIDLSRMASPQMYALLGQILLFVPIDLYSDKVDAIARAGVKDLYLLAPPRALWAEHPDVCFVAMVSSSQQEKQLRAALRLRPEEGQTMKGAVIVAWPHNKKFRPVERPALKAAFEAAGDTAAQVILIPPADTRRVVEELMPQLPADFGGGPISVFTRGVRWAALGIDLSPKSLRLVVQSESHEAADALRDKLVDLSKVAARLPAVQKKVPNFGAIAAMLAPRVDGDRLVLASDEKKHEFESVWAALTEPIQVLQAKAASVNNLKYIALAMMNYEQAYGQLTPPHSRDANGKPLLSWRVHLLPFMEKKGLYDQFHLNEPWDSEHNRALIAKMPECYRLPISKTERGRTNYLLPVGNGAAFSPDKPTRMRDITDGTSATIMMVEVDDDHAVIWTKPDDWMFEPKEPTKGLGRFFDGAFHTAYCDGSVRTIMTTANPEMLRRAFMRADGKPVQGL